MDHPLVSVIITNYNYGKYIAKAIDSVLAQTYPNLEIIVVDDGSTDDSAETIGKYGTKITTILQQNAGVVAARQRGYEASGGEFISFVDADDVLDAGFYQKLVEPLLLADEKVAFSYCDQQLFGADEARIPANQWNWRKLLYRNYVVVSAPIRRSALEAIGGYKGTRDGRYSFEDWEFWLRLVKKGYSGIYVPGTLFYYRIHKKGRNRQGLRHRQELEAQLQRRFAGLYGRPSARLYLLVFRNLSKIRNLLLRPPGT